MHHTTFLNILKGLDPLEHKKYDTFDIYSTDSDSIIETAPYYLQGVKREQILIETNKDYYIARDSKTNTVYICYKNILMLDFDNDDVDVLNLLQSESDKSFKIYKTKRGYHAFCISQPFEYRNKETVEYMLKFPVDVDYIRYCYIRGFCTRLNRKFEESNGDLYEYITITNEGLVNKDLEKLVDLHIKKSKKYKNEINMNLSK